MATTWSRPFWWFLKLQILLRSKICQVLISPLNTPNSFLTPVSKIASILECTNMVAVSCRDALKRVRELKSWSWPTTSSSTWTIWSKTSMETTWSKTCSSWKTHGKMSKFSFKSLKILLGWVRWSSQATSLRNAWTRRPITKDTVISTRSLRVLSHMMITKLSPDSDTTSSSKKVWRQEWTSLFRNSFTTNLVIMFCRGHWTWLRTRRWRRKFSTLSSRCHHPWYKWSTVRRYLPSSQSSTPTFLAGNNSMSILIIISISDPPITHTNKNNSKWILIRLSNHFNRITIFKINSNKTSNKTRLQNSIWIVLLSSPILTKIMSNHFGPKRISTSEWQNVK